MDVDVDLARIERHEKRQHRVAVARQVIGIGGAHGADEKLVAHRPSVDEQVLAERIGAREGRQRRIAFDAQTFAPGRDRNRIGAELRAENVAEPGQPSRSVGQRRGPGDGGALLAGQREGDIGTAHGEPAYDFAHGLAFGAVALEKFQPRGRRKEQIPHLDARAFAERGRTQRRLDAAFDVERPGVRLTGMAGGDGQPRHRADGRKRLAAEAERMDGEQVLVVGELGGGVALNRKREIGARHAGAVVGDADQPAAAAVGHDLDAARAGIERILHQLLDDARRPLHHLAGGDAVDEAFGQLADGHESLPSTCDAVRHPEMPAPAASSSAADPLPVALRSSLAS
ncbi:MAG: hypothetical protein GHHEDOFH_01823 [Pseudorhodoplanes sp.]|nr:hypothetical protein [Pseudorhodoplanes sp.]